jgi:DNA-binding transcriptional LysR family regulator
MDLFQLETFLAVAREGSFSRAAQVLHRTQPAVSQTIRKLEQHTGEILIDRSSREGILTDAGRVLREYAEKLLNVRAAARTALHELRHVTQGHLTLAANELTCLYLLPLLEQFRRMHPGVKITVQRSLASRIPLHLLSHGVDLGVLSYKPEDPGLRSTVVYRDELAFVVPRSHPLAGVKEVHIRQLGAESFVAHHVPSPYRAKVLQTFQRRRVPLNMQVEMPTIEAIKKFVASGNGVALVPAVCVQAEIERGELARLPVPELAFERKIRLVYRRGAGLSHAARAFLRIAEKHAQAAKGRYLYQPEH